MDDRRKKIIASSMNGSLIVNRLKVHQESIRYQFVVATTDYILVYLVKSSMMQWTRHAVTRKHDYLFHFDLPLLAGDDSFSSRTRLQQKVSLSSRLNLFFTNWSDSVRSCSLSCQFFFSSVHNILTI